MTIELSPPATTPAKPSEAQAAKSKSKSGTSDGKPDAGANGFMAILGSIDGTAAATDTGDATTPDTSTPSAGAMDPNTLLLQNPQIAAAMQGVAIDAAGKGVDANALAASLASSGSQKGGGSQKGQDASLPQDGKGGVRPVRLGVGDVQESVPRDVTISQESATVGLQHAGAHAKGGKDSLPTLSDSTSSTAANATAATPASDHKEAVDAKFLAALEQAKAAPASKVAEPALVALNNRPEKSQSERAIGGAKNADPTYTGTAIGVTGPDFSQTAAQPTAMAPDMQVAEQVTYWVSQNVQNAEMKLDGLGHSPVEVSISVQGNEAQIAFRSDEAMTRGVLESAGAHLKDMLQREGMVLTGVSVGTSGSGDSGAGDRRGRQSARQVAIAPLQPVVASGAARAGAATGRSVDLFV
ncbi:flagellar hook-length control protein FliK [Rhodoferax sp. GW822-FHT02A01]|uniref:flagellar hook-length control protein FliK n=1 Tax=Rhodoferax sp. GW822-FHT02A01 TaxID=3141537 RepID=UPI00315CC490